MPQTCAYYRSFYTRSLGCVLTFACRALRWPHQWPQVEVPEFGSNQKLYCYCFFSFCLELHTCFVSLSNICNGFSQPFPLLPAAVEPCTALRVRTSGAAAHLATCAARAAALAALVAAVAACAVAEAQEAGAAAQGAGATAQGAGATAQGAGATAHHGGEAVRAPAVAQPVVVVVRAAAAAGVREGKGRGVARVGGEVAHVVLGEGRGANGGTWRAARVTLNWRVNKHVAVLMAARGLGNEVKMELLR